MDRDPDASRHLTGDSIDLLAARSYAESVGVTLQEGLAAMRFQYAAMGVVDEVEAALGDACGEVWYDRSREAGMRLKVGVVGHGDPPAGARVEAAKRILARPGLLERCDFVATNVSATQFDDAVDRVSAALGSLGWQARASPDATSRAAERRVVIDTVDDLDAEQQAIVDAAVKAAGIPVRVDRSLGPGENTGLPSTPRKEVGWVLLSAGEDPRSLLIQYFWGGRFRDKPEVSVNEAAMEVQIAITLPDLMQDPRIEVLLGFAAAGTLTVWLTAPVNGRRITGPERAFLDGEPHAVAYKTIRDDEGVARWRVPRVLGLAPEDAAWVLRSQGFAPHSKGEGNRIVDQDPEPEEIASGQSGSFHGHVRLTVGN